jgi:hypothetical protein
MKQKVKDKGCEPLVEEDSIAAQQAMLQYWTHNLVGRTESGPFQEGASAEQPCPKLSQPDIHAYIRDMSAYVKHIDELGPEATAGLISMLISDCKMHYSPCPMICHQAY